MRFTGFIFEIYGVELRKKPVILHQKILTHIDMAEENNNKSRWQRVKDTAKAGIGLVTKDANEDGTSFNQNLKRGQQVVDNVKATARKVGEAVGNTAQKVRNTVNNTAEKMGNAIKKTAEEHPVATATVLGGPIAGATSLAVQNKDKIKEGYNDIKAKTVDWLNRFVKQNEAQHKNLPDQARLADNKRREQIARLEQRMVKKTIDYPAVKDNGDGTYGALFIDQNGEGHYENYNSLEDAQNATNVNYTAPRERTPRDVVEEAGRQADMIRAKADSARIVNEARRDSANIVNDKMQTAPAPKKQAQKDKPETVHPVYHPQKDKPWKGDTVLI